MVAPPEGRPGALTSTARLATVLELVVLISGAGSNLRALLDAASDAEYPARVVAIGADRDAEGLALGEEYGIPTFTVPFTSFATRQEWGAALAEQIRPWTPDLLVLSGFMRLLLSLIHI